MKHVVFILLLGIWRVLVCLPVGFVAILLMFGEGDTETAERFVKCCFLDKS